ncbi:trichohyalin-like isoform X2 [Mercenaria mercenaria]|uniref:trichohyalin-like isoform X2 n=1 Tax=Mercenaria mercenaria TaxID=6596 RepID=UPI00234FA3C9|nr:trichohyalin-like isoform X2 [Mercenaria mercenaria]
MGVHDFEAMFDTVDLTRKGVVTAEQLHEFCENLYYTPICIQHIEGAIKVVCGSSGMVTRQEFLDVLTEVERRRATEEEAYWDFQGLDYTGRNRITPSDTLLLFKEIHGEKFSLATWHRFLSSREYPEADVFFDEVRFWLCDLPVGSACSDKDLKEEENKMLMQQMQFETDVYRDMQDSLEDDDSRLKEQEEHVEHQMSNARRKLNKWNHQGLEAMLFDDGLDIDESKIKGKPKGQVNMSDLNELLEMKYEALKEKLMMEMAKQAAAVEEEIPEVLQQIQRQVKILIRDGSSYTGTVPGGSYHMLASLAGLMGELRLHDREHRRQIDEMKVRLMEKGKSARDIATAVQDRYEQIISGDSLCSGLMLQLHRRHRQEREALLSTLKIDMGNPLNQSMIIEYARLMRQILLMEQEAGFVSVATTVGLAERAMEPRIDRSDWDRSRTERLAQLRIQERVGKSQLKTPQDIPDRSFLQKLQIVDLQVELVREMTKKHFYEREALIFMMQGREAKDGIDKARKMKADDRKHQLKVLQSQHQNWKSNPRADKTVLRGILMQSMCLRYEERKNDLESSGSENVSDEEMREVLLADLQQRQGLDFEVTLQELQIMSQDQMIKVFGKQCTARIEEHYDNIAIVMLGTLDVTEEDEEYIKALESKYERLRKTMLLMSLKDQMDWRSLSKEEKQAAMKDIIKQEKLFRSEGKMLDMETLLGPKAKAKILPALRTLIGEDKAEYRRRKQQQKHDEDPIDNNKIVNLLADLVPRFDNEQEYLLSWLHSPEAKSLSLRMKRMRIVEIKIEAYRVEVEEDFETATLSIGLMERVKDTLTLRHESDIDRQRQLSRKRVQQRRLRLQQHEEYTKEPEVAKDKIPASGDITGLQVVYLREMLKRHSDEREVILNHLQDESLDDLVEAATTMSEDERQRRLIELQGKRQNLNLTNPDDKEEHVNILEEAAALRAVSVKEQLAQAGNTNNMEAIAVVLLAELQEEQDREVAMTLEQIEDMNEEDIRTCLSREINNRRLGNAWNVIAVFTRYQGEATDDLLLKALENKYTVLRQKLLVDCIRIRMGTDQWEELSQNEKQQKVMTLDAQAVEQIKIGQIMPSLLGEGFHLQETVTQIIGVCQHVFRNKVKGQHVLGNQSNFSMEEDTGAVSKKGQPDNPLRELYSRLEEERNALNRQLKGQSEDHFSESERLAQLARYHREALLASQEEAFVTVATMVGLMERQQEEIKFRLVKDAERYLKLSKKTILDVQKGKQSSLETEAPQTRSAIQHVDHILTLLETKHIKERELFCRLLWNTDKFSDAKEQAAMSTPQERVNKMNELRDTRAKTVRGRRSENLEVLTEATVYKKEGCRLRLSEEIDEVTEERVCCTLMALLLEYQNCEAERLIKTLAAKNDDGIQTEEKRILEETKSNMADNIALVVLSPDPTDGTTDDEVIDALKGKYDVLKDKLLAEALMKELGEAEWNRLSDKERQRKIFQLKKKERQLRKAGKIDEANALIAELLQDQENLRKLMGDTVQDQRQKLQDRLKRRKERLAQGMSEEEVDELERQEIEAEEEEEKKKRRNILEDLEYRFEKEKEELLRRLGEADNEFDRERERQANLARLKRDQRLAEKEGNFDGAALILGLAEKRDRDARLAKEEERLRQEKLARERLEAARNRKKEGKEEEEDTDIGPVDTEDPASLQEAIAHDMDRRHRQERSIFMKLMEESVDSKQRTVAKEMSDDERGDRIFEINELYKNWKNSDDKDLKEQMELLKDAISVMLEIIRCESEAKGQIVTDDDLQVKLLADLQEQQRHEAQRLLNDLQDKDLKGLQQLHRAVTMLNKDSSCDNIAAVLLGDRSRSEDESEEEEESGETTDASVVKALEEKYDAMKDKLLMEALIKEHGEAEWNRMSEKQRQKKLIDLKLKERQLRREGKMDEIANIIGSHLENEKLLDDFLVENEQQQRERLEARMKRRKQLKAEREAEGLAADDATVNAIVEEEEAAEMRQKRRNILEDLQKNFDDEKAKLLKTLSHQKDKSSRERHRQIELAKLKRDERRMKKGEKLNEIVMIIHSSKEEERRREKGITAERERQRNVAKERLEARKQKKQQKQTKKEDEEISALEDVVKDSEERNIHEALFTTLEDKHYEETDMLMAILELAKSDKRADGKPDEELKSQLTKLEQEHLKWRKRSVQQVSELNEENLTAEQSQKHMSDVAKNRSDQLKILTDALVYRLEVERRLLQQHRSDLSFEAQEEEVEVALVTDLQEKQTAEGRALQRLLDDQNDKVLKDVRKGQHVACREGWFDNLTRTVFHVSHSLTASEEEDDINEKYNNAVAELEQGLEQEIQNAIQKAQEKGEEFDMEAIRREIMRQFDEQKQRLLAEKEAQKAAVLRKLEAHRMSREQHDYEDLAARQLLKQAEDQMKQLEASVAEEKGKQSNMLQHKLRERRDARKEAKTMREELDRESTLDMYDDRRAPSQRSSNDTPLPPFGGMRREKTVVDVDITEDQKQAFLAQMTQQQRNLQNKISAQQKKQEEMLRRRLEARQGKQKEEAAEVLSLGHRQKTILMKSQQDEKERQLTKMKEKVAKQREKRVPSPGFSKHKGK